MRFLRLICLASFLYSFGMLGVAYCDPVLECPHVVRTQGLCNMYVLVGIPGTSCTASSVPPFCKDVLV